MRLVEQIRKGSRAAIQSLYDEVQRSARPYLRWRLGVAGTAELDDRLHDAFLAALEAIQAGAIRDPERLSAFVRTIVRHQATMAIRKATRERRNFDIGEYLELADQSPGQERVMLAAERSHLLRDVLDELRQPDREILVRFYLSGQTRQTICKDLELTSTQFRLRKSRAKARLKTILASRVILTPRSALRV